jgi:hypothetical protein
MVRVLGLPPFFLETLRPVDVCLFLMRDFFTELFISGEVGSLRFTCNFVCGDAPFFDLDALARVSDLTVGVGSLLGMPRITRRVDAIISVGRRFSKKIGCSTD